MATATQDPSGRGPSWTASVWIFSTLVLALGFALRVRCFHPYADDWDPCEYVWAVDGGYLPHSPYIFYLWVGRLLSLVAPTDIALSFFSLVSGTVAVALLALLVRRQSRDTLAAIVAAAAYAAFPSAVWHSAIQEVYAPAVALGLAAFLLADSQRPRSAGLAGLLFGCALATHSGIVFLAPAFLFALVGGAARGSSERTLRRVLVAACGAVLVPAVAVAWVALELPRTSAGSRGLWDYLVGIAPLDTGVQAWSLDSLRRTLEGSLEETVGTGVAALVLLLLCACLTCVRFPRPGLHWAVWAVPYLLYEWGIGYNVDPGVHMVFTGPAIAAFAGHGAAAGAVWLSTAHAQRMARLAAPAWVVVVLIALVPVTHSFNLARGLPSRATFLSSEPVASLIAVRSTTRADAVLVQPPTLGNVNLAPAYSARRPIIHEAGRFLLFDGSRGAPLNPTSFAPVTPEVLERLVQDGIPVVSLVPEPFRVAEAGFRWRPVGAHYVLERALPKE